MPSHSAAAPQAETDPPAVGEPSAALPTDAEREEAKRLYADGSSLYQQGRYRAAITAFERGYSLSGDANFLFNIALALDRLDAYDDALAAFARYRAATPDADHTEIEERERGLRLRRADAEAKAAEVVAPPEPTDEVVCPETPPPPIPTTQPLPPPPQRIMTPGAIVLASLTGAAVITSAVLGSISLRETASAQEQCVDGPQGLRCSSESADELQRAGQMALGADISIGIAAAAAAGLVAVIVVNAHKRKREREQRADVAASVGGLRIRF